MSDREQDAEDLEPRTGPLDPLLHLPRLIAGALDDIHTIAQSVRYLPELAKILTTIQNQVDSLDDEVRRMRSKVDEIGGDVVVMRGAVEPLEEQLAGVRGAVAPIGRLAERLPRRRRDAVDPDELAETD